MELKRRALPRASSLAKFPNADGVAAVAATDWDETIPAPPPLGEGGQTSEATEPCFYATVTVRDAVQHMIRGEWDIPDFQRGFVWGPREVCLLADSLMRGYPIPILLLWRGDERCRGTQAPCLWVVDGQHRLTSMCLLFGLAPAWSANREDLMRRCEIRVDPGARRPPFLRPASETGPGSLPTSTILAADSAVPARLMHLASEMKQRSGCTLTTDELYRRLKSVQRIGESSLIVSVADVSGTDVHEIFIRLNGRGIRFRRLLLKMMMQAVPGFRRWKYG
jgi:uncharacterized protein DUF262